MYVQALILQLRQLCWNVLKTTSDNCYPVPNRLAYTSDGETRFLLTSIKVKNATTNPYNYHQQQPQT